MLFPNFLNTFISSEIERFVLQFQGRRQQLLADLTDQICEDAREEEKVCCATDGVREWLERQQDALHLKDSLSRGSTGSTVSRHLVLHVCSLYKYTWTLQVVNTPPVRVEAKPGAWSHWTAWAGAESGGDWGRHSAASVLSASSWRRTSSTDEVQEGEVQC